METAQKAAFITVHYIVVEKFDSSKTADDWHTRSKIFTPLTWDALEVRLGTPHLWRCISSAGSASWELLKEVQDLKDGDVLQVVRPSLIWLSGGVSRGCPVGRVLEDGEINAAQVAMCFGFDKDSMRVGTGLIKVLDSGLSCNFTQLVQQLRSQEQTAYAGMRPCQPIHINGHQIRF